MALRRIHQSNEGKKEQGKKEGSKEDEIEKVQVQAGNTTPKRG